MDKFLEKVMNFINENTMLLIIICIFLIIILVIYLIDNTIKTKRLEKAQLEKDSNPEPKVLDNSIPSMPVSEQEITPTIEEPKVEEMPAIPEETTVQETPVVEPTVVEAPIIDSGIEELINKDYSSNNEIVNNITIEEPKVETPKSKYNNDKKLSDIFAKKEQPAKKNFETTQDFSDELDRILQKLNSEDNNSLEGTNDYTNMF